MPVFHVCYDYFLVKWRVIRSIQTIGVDSVVKVVGSYQGSYRNGPEIFSGVFLLSKDWNNNRELLTISK